MPKQTKAKNVAVLAIFLFVAIMAIGEFGGLFSISQYGGRSTQWGYTDYYVGDVIDISGSRSSSEITATCSDAYHYLTISTSNLATNKAVVQDYKQLGAITLVNGKYVIGGNSMTSAYRFSFTAGESRLPIGNYVSKEYIECDGKKITKDTNNIWYFTITAKPADVIITKKCVDIGQRIKTTSCYYKECEIKNDGTWDWSTEKQSSSFCDITTPIDPIKIPSLPTCQSVWRASDWSDCIDGIQTRTVWDNTQCNIATGTKPNTQQNCIALPIFEEPIVQPPINDTYIDPLEFCKEKGFTGYDSSTNTCTKTSAESDFLSENKYYIAGGIVLLFAWASGLTVYLSKRK